MRVHEGGRGMGGWKKWWIHANGSGALVGTGAVCFQTIIIIIMIIILMMLL